jgi:hypothetical protein
MEIDRAAVHESVFAGSKCFVRSPDVPSCMLITSRQNLEIAPATELESLSRLSGSELPRGTKRNSCYTRPGISTDISARFKWVRDLHSC